MELSFEHKKAMFIFGAGVLLFLLIKPKNKKTKSGMLNFSSEDEAPESRVKLKEPTMSAKDAKKNPQARNAFAALKGYIAAYNNKEPQSVLNELNSEFEKEFKVKVHKRKSDGKLVVCDLNGKEILINN